MDTKNDSHTALGTHRHSRREMLKHLIVAGVALPSLSSLLSGCGSGGSPGATNSGSAPGAQAEVARPLTVTYYDWIINLHPAIEGEVNKDFALTTPIKSQIAPVQGFGIERFVAEARDKMSSWDVYVGMTPFIEMSSLVEAGVIEPWDNYIPKEVLDDIIPAIREEGSINGKLYNWPFFVDVIVQGWHAGLVEKAGVDPEVAPKTWDEYLANARKVSQSKAAPYGCTFDAHGWRSLAPIAHSISTEVYTPEGLFDFTNAAAVEALEIMRRMKEFANPNVLNPGAADAGINDTPDEGVFAAQQAAYYIKYQNAHRRFAGTWPDPGKLRLAGLPKTAGGVGGSVFWTTGAALFTFGANKEQAGKYMRALTYDERIWRHSIGKSREAVGHMPPYTSQWKQWSAKHPEWIDESTFLIQEKMASSRSIKANRFGVTQFNIGQPYWEKYLKGEEADSKKAMQQAKDAVMAEFKKAR